MGLLWFFKYSTKFLLYPALLVFGSSFFHTPPLKLSLLFAPSVWGVLFPFATSFIWHNRVKDVKNSCSIALFSIFCKGGKKQEEPLGGTSLSRRPFLLQVLQRSVWETSLHLQPGQRWNPLSGHGGWKWLSPMISNKPLQPFKARCVLLQHLAARCSAWPLQPFLESA